MLKLNVKNETSRLKAVVLGTAESNGPTPSLEDAYDPKSALHIKEGTYPLEKDMVPEMEAVATIFKKYDVEVYRPKLIKDMNQIFTRDIGFVIDDKFFKANILPDREEEIDAIEHIIKQVAPTHVFRLPEEAHIEGGDVMLADDHIFIGTYRGADYPDYIIARTNMLAVGMIQELFPNKKVMSFDLRKSNTDPYSNALHLDCCFQPVGDGKAILHKNGFLQENVFEISSQEMFNMNSNIFSISPEVVISERNFTRLNTWLRDQNITVEEVAYAEIAKQEGLLRCSTLPLIRE